MLEAIVTSDWHFDGMKNHFPTNHAAMVALEVQRVYQYAVAHSIPYIIVPGDIADNYKISPDSVREILGILAAYDSFVTTYYMLGNHDHGDVNSTSLDIFKTMSEFKMLKNFHVITEPTLITLDKVDLNFCPFPFTELSPTRRPAINFIHRDIDGAIGDNGRKLRVKNDVLLDERDFTFAGHIHKHQYLKSRRAVICGNLYQKNFGESLDKGFVTFKAKYKNNKLKVDWEFIPQVPRFRLETVSIDTQKQFSKLEANQNIRYRLYVGEGIVVPKNIRKDIPNIDQIWEYTGKKILANEDISDRMTQDIKEIPTIDPLTGLKEFFKAAGMTKEEFKYAKTKVLASLENI